MERYFTFLFLDPTKDEKIKNAIKSILEAIEFNNPNNKDQAMFLIQGIANETEEGLKDTIDRHGMDYRIHSIITLDKKTQNVYIYKDENIELINEKITNAIKTYEVENIISFKRKNVIDKRDSKYESFVARNN